MTARPRYPRSSCCVIGCRRTSTLFKGEWICGPHYRLVDKSLKRFRTKRLREIYRLAQSYAVRAEGFRQGSDHSPSIARAYQARRERLARANARWVRLEKAIWRRMKRQAIERAVGISA